MFETMICVELIVGLVLLTEVDRLSTQAQAGLRRTMEKYAALWGCFMLSLIVFV